MTPLNHIIRKCTVGYKLSKSQEKINQLMYMDDIKLFAKNEKRTGKEHAISHIQWSGIWHRKMRHARNKKWQTTLDGRNGTTKPVLEISGMWSTPSLPLLPGPL